MGIKSDKRSGVAVIIVLGLLGLLMMLAVAFSVSMRIERRSAGNYSSGVVAKQFLWGGLARAIDAIDYEMANAIAVYPPFDVFWTSNGLSQVNIISSEVMDTIPGSLHDILNGLPPVYWQDFNSAGARGYYAFVILNCSGMLDMNFVGGASRGAGTNVNELQIQDLTSVDMGDFEYFRDRDVRYETLAELATLNSGIDPDDPEHVFETFSRYPVGILLNGGTANAAVSAVPQVDVSGDVSALTSQSSEIIAALELALQNPSLGDSDFVFNNLLDYIDTDCVPTNLNSACTERVPMINEIRISRVLLKRTATGCELRAQLTIENTYTFMNRVNQLFDTTGAVELSVTPSGGAPETHMEVFVEDSLYRSTAPLLSYFTPTVNLGPVSFANPSATNAFSFSVSVLGVTNRIAAGGAAVDSVTVAPGNTDFSLMSNAVLAVGGQLNVNNDLSMEVRDPRYNWDASAGGSSMWRRPWPSSGANMVMNTDDAVNSWAQRYFDARASGNKPEYEKDASMHVSDRGYLVSVGELGNLLRAKTSGYWETIRLLDQIGNIPGAAPHDTVFNHFTVSTNAVRRGLVNINSLEPVVLDAVFKNMALAFPESGVINAPDVTNLCDTILDWRGRPDGANNEFYNVSDMAEINWDARFSSRSDLEREAMLAYSYGLFGTRQNLFTIIVAATPTRASMGTVSSTVQTLGLQRAIVQVWRDPFPNADGKHECFVRFFKWLSY